MMLRICGWCGRWLGGSAFARPPSHGICRPCAREQLEEAGVLSREDLDALWTDLGGEG